MFSSGEPIAIQSDLDIAQVRARARSLARTQGFTTLDQARIATTASHLARMLLNLAGDGTVNVGTIEDHGRSGIAFFFEHTKAPPNIIHHGNLEEPHFLSGSGTGMPDVRRVMDDFDLQLHECQGFTLRCCKWLDTGDP